MGVNSLLRLRTEDFFEQKNISTSPSTTIHQQDVHLKNRASIFNVFNLGGTTETTILSRI